MVIEQETGIEPSVPTQPEIEQAPEAAPPEPSVPSYPEPEAPAAAEPEAPQGPDETEPGRKRGR